MEGAYLVTRHGRMVARWNRLCSPDDIVSSARLETFADGVAGASVIDPILSLIVFLGLAIYWLPRSAPKRASSRVGENQRARSSASRRGR